VKRVILLITALALVSLLVACGVKTQTPQVETKAPAPTAKPTELPMPTPLPTESPTDTPPPPTPLPTDTPPPPAESPTDTPVPPPTDTPTLQPQPQAATLAGRFFFPVFDAEAGTYNIFSAKPDGSDRKMVVAEASQPTINSTGQRIAFRSWKADNRGLIERGVEGGDIWRFDSYFEAARPTFSPDDQSLLFQSREAGEKPAIYRTVGLEYEVLRREANPIQGEAPAWTPDGNRFVYKGCLGSNCGLILSNLDGSFPQQLTQNLSDTNPAVSPDGKTIVFMSENNGTWDVYMVGIDGTGRKQLTTDPADDGLPTWSPNGKMIAFASDRSGEWAMWAMDANGGNQRLLFELGGSIDGKVQIDVQDSFGWLEESIDWAP
jgi:Tol biopolymer transport system component